MNWLELLGVKKPSKKDRLTLFIYSQISMLHDQKIPYKDMEEIKHKVSEIIRKHNPLKDLTVVGSLTSRKLSK